LDLILQVRDQVRTLFRVRRERVLPRAGHRPAVGARIAAGELRMSVQAGMSEDLWRWLAKRGWREVVYRPDRRRYRDIPCGFATMLIDASPDERESILEAGIANSAVRTMQPRGIRLPTLSGGPRDGE
jgi:hypothetical protein